jgi:hypothetical protein
LSGTVRVTNPRSTGVAPAPGFVRRTAISLSGRVNELTDGTVWAVEPPRGRKSVPIANPGLVRFSVSRARSPCPRIRKEAIMTCRRAISLAAVLLTVALSGCSSSDKPKNEPPLTRQDTVEISATAKVMAVDQATRIMTIRDDSGHELTFRVADRVRRLNEVKPGDDVKTTYRATLLAELRPPTAEESAKPYAILTTSERSPQGTAPSASVSQAVRVVTTVQAVDVPNMLVTLRGPMSDLAVVHGRKAENVKKLRVGDTIVITFTETAAIALEKIAPR